MDNSRGVNMAFFSATCTSNQAAQPQIGQKEFADDLDRQPALKRQASSNDYGGDNIVRTKPVHSLANLINN